jgi:hypothetical protein
MTNWRKTIKTKAGILEPARQSGNVSQACKATGHSRDSFYRFKTLYETVGEASPMETGGQKPNEKNRADPIFERAAADFAYERAAYGQLRASDELKKQGMPVSPGGVRSVRLRHDMSAFKGRLRALEAKTARENLIPAESRLAALERAKEEKEAHGETGTERPGHLGAQDIYYAGNIKGAGHISRQTFIDTYSKAAFRKPYGRKNAPVAANMLNDAVIPFFDSHGLPPLRVLTDRGSECCGNWERREYALYPEVENTGHTGTKAKSLRTDGICEGFNRTCKNGFHSAAFRRKACRSIAELQHGTPANGRGSIMRSGRTAGNTVTGRRRCGPSRVRCR